MEGDLALVWTEMSIEGARDNLASQASQASYPWKSFQHWFLDSIVQSLVQNASICMLYLLRAPCEGRLSHFSLVFMV